MSCWTQIMILFKALSKEDRGVDDWYVTATLDLASLETFIMVLALFVCI